MKSESINNHCGCGKSFSLKTGDVLTDKIQSMKLVMKQKREGIHKEK
jgi:hypothetical protein